MVNTTVRVENPKTQVKGKLLCSFHYFSFDNVTFYPPKNFSVTESLVSIIQQKSSQYVLLHVMSMQSVILEISVNVCRPMKEMVSTAQVGLLTHVTYNTILFVDRIEKQSQI